MPLFNQISIIGVGLIGGSLAKAIRKNRISHKIVGFFRNKEKLNRAVKEKIVDAGYLDLKLTLQNSDLIILSLPISEIIKFLFRIKKILKSETLIIDAGSTKSKITSTADRLNLKFLGTHPLAGSEKKGFSFSSTNLFDKSLVIITPTKKTDKKTVDKIKLFWKKLNAEVITLSSKEHDRILSFTSHLPHVIAFSLINSIPGEFFKFSATGLRDSTRVALSDAKIWADIFLSNKKELLHSLDCFEGQIKKIKNNINQEKNNQLIRFLSKSKLKREKIDN